MSAIIPINAKYRIELDNNSWQISHWRLRKSHPDGGIWEGLSCHRTLQQAGESLLQRLVAQQDLEGLDEIINALSASSRLIVAAIIESGIPNSWLDAKKHNTDIEQ